MQAIVLETELPTSIASLICHKFSKPPINQPDFSNSNNKNKGPLVYSAKTPAVALPHVTTLQPIGPIFEDIIKKCENKVYEVYPHTKGCITHKHCVPPILGGHRLSNTTAKYSTPLSSTTEIPVSILFTLPLKLYIICNSKYICNLILYMVYWYIYL